MKECIKMNSNKNKKWKTVACWQYFNYLCLKVTKYISLSNVIWKWNVEILAFYLAISLEHICYIFTSAQLYFRSKHLLYYFYLAALVNYNSSH